MTPAPHDSIPLEHTPRSDQEILARARSFRALMIRRHSVREFSARPVERAVIEQCLLAAGSAPNGANLQPWHFVAVSSPEVKRRIREAAEAEERAFYDRRAGEAWLADLAPLGTDARKPFLDIAPWLIAVFARPWSLDPAGQRRKHYYVNESVGIASGLLVTALHHAGLATLTHTPSPMGFLSHVLDRPDNERPYLLVVAGHPAPEARVPVHATHKLPLAELATFV